MSARNHNFDIGISYVETFPNIIAEELCQDLERIGFKIEVERRRPEGPTVAVEWLLPTAFIVFLSHKFFGTLLQEAAKDLYPVLKEALLKVIKLTCGKNRKITMRIVASAPMKTSSDTVAAFTIYAQLRINRSARFTFAEDLEERRHSAALDNLLSVIRDHYIYYPNDPLTKAMKLLDPGGQDEIHMKFDEEEAGWRVVNTRDEMERRRRAREAELKAKGLL